MAIKAVLCYDAGMNIRSAKFVKGLVEADELLEDGKPQVAFIGRSNVGKSSTINALTNQKGLARTSSFPGRTKEINLFLINKSLYLVDLPGYGFSKVSWAGRDRLRNLISWYLLESPYKQKKVVLIIDAYVGMTATDLDMFEALAEQKKHIVIIANKVDKIKKSEVQTKLKKIQDLVGRHKIIPFSAEKGTGVKELIHEILN